MSVGVKRSRRGARIALGAATPAVLALVLAQALLPTIAAHRVRARVARYGTVHSASVSAWPAVELLWGHAGSASVSAGRLTLTPAQLAGLMWEARNVTSVTVTVQSATLLVAGLPHGITFSDVTTSKRGSQVRAHATLTQSQLDASLPNGFRVQPLASGPEGVQVRASGGLFGASVSLAALVAPVDGRLVAEPEGFPLAGLAAVTLFSDPHLLVRSVGVSVIARSPLTYRLSLAATVA